MTSQAWRPTAKFAFLGAMLLVLLITSASPSRAAANCDKTWAAGGGNGSGNWNVAGNWSPVGVPGGLDDVCITGDGTYTVTIKAIDGQINTSGGGADELHIGGTSGTATLEVVGHLVPTGMGHANQGSNSASLSSSTGLINSHGAVTFSSDDPNSNASWCSGDPGIENEGTITWNGGGGSRTLQGEITNGPTGSFNVNTDLTIPSTSSCGDNRLTNSGGSVSVANGATFTDQTSYRQSSGSTAVNGSLNVGGNFEITGGTFTGNRTVLNAPMQATVTAGTADLTIHGGAALHAEGGHPGVGVGANIDLRIEGTATQDSIVNFAADADTVANNGKIHLTSTDAGHNVQLHATDGDPNSLTNNGTIETLAGSGGGRTLGQGITNAASGLIHIGADTGASGLRLTNSGGQITVDANKTFAMSGNPFTQTSGTITNNGSMTKTGSTFVMSGGTINGANPIELSGANGGGLQPTAGSGSFVMHGGEIGSNVGAGFTIINEATTGNSNVNFTPDGLTNAGTIRLTSTGANTAQLSAASNNVDSLTNTGTIETLGSTGGRVLGQWITNNPTGTIHIGADTGPTGLRIKNAGGQITVDSGKTFTLDGNTFSQSSGTTTNNGTITKTGGQTIITGGTIDGANPITLSGMNGGGLQPSAGSGSFLIHGGGEIGSNVGAGFTITNEATTGNSNVNFSADGLTNAGTIKLTSTGANTAQLAAASGNADSLTNTGTIETLGGNGGRVLGQWITNSTGGLIHIGADTGASGLRLANSGGQITVDSGKTFGMSGNPFTQTSGTITNNGSMTKTGSTFVVSGGTINGANPIELSGANGGGLQPTAGTGSFVMHGGEIGSSVGSGFTIIIEATAGSNSQVRFAADNATNAGTIRLTSTVNNQDARIEGADGDPDSLTNTGTIETVPGSGGSRSLGQGITNGATGTIHIGADTGGAALRLTNAGGQITVDASKTFTLSGNPFAQTSGTTTINGTMQKTGGATVVSGGAFNGANPMDLSGMNAGGLQPTAGSGSFRIHNGGEIGSSVGANFTILIEATAGTNSQVRFAADNATNAGTIRLTSTVNNQDARIEGADGDPDSLTNTGTIETVAGSGGSRTISQGITNGAAGTIHIGADTFGGFAVLTNAGGQITVDQGATFNLGGQTFNQPTAGTTTAAGTLSTTAAVNIGGGTLRGGGNVTAASVNNTGGTVAPGTSPGNLSITGNYTQAAGGTLATEIGGTNPGTGYDRLAVSGTATLNGTLAITTPGFSLSPGQAYQVLTAANRTGTFGTVTGGAPFNVQYNATNVTLQVVDADSDGVADGADNCPTAANANQADADADGIGDACDSLNDNDGDGVGNGSDNCPSVANSGQADSDADGQGDACDADADGDGANDATDNCPGVANADQANNDGDAQGDACDPDDDNDGVADTSDACPTVAANTANGCQAATPPVAGTVTVADGPDKKTTKKKATFTFSAPNAASFQCSLDGKPFAPCASPFTVKKLKPGKHTLAIRAIGADGQPGATTTYKWKVKKKKKH
jgi:hypothetical protein